MARRDFSAKAQTPNGGSKSFERLLGGNFQLLESKAGSHYTTGEIPLTGRGHSPCKRNAFRLVELSDRMVETVSMLAMTLLRYDAEYIYVWDYRTDNSEKCLCRRSYFDKHVSLKCIAKLKKLVKIFPSLGLLLHNHSTVVSHVS